MRRLELVSDPRARDAAGGIDHLRDAVDAEGVLAYGPSGKTRESAYPERETEDDEKKEYEWQPQHHAFPVKNAAAP